MSVMEAALEVAGPDAAEPVVDPADAARAELAAAVVRLRHMPDRLDRTLALAARGDLRFRTVVAEDESRVLRTLVNRALLTAAGAVFLVTAAVLLAASNGRPGAADGTDIFEILGYGGLLAGSVLLLRVVAQVARDGTT
jgi:hypothetical protein